LGKAFAPFQKKKKFYVPVFFSPEINMNPRSSEQWKMTASYCSFQLFISHHSDQEFRIDSATHKISTS
jgi:hypothetical protein